MYHGETLADEMKLKVQSNQAYYGGQLQGVECLDRYIAILQKKSFLQHMRVGVLILTLQYGSRVSCKRCYAI